MENNNWRLIQGGEPTYWRPFSETSSSSIGSTAQNGGWQEEIYQKIKTMKELYLPELFEMYQKVDAKLQQIDSLPQQPNWGQLDKLKLFKNTLERVIQFLQIPKANIVPSYKEKLAHYEKQIISFINVNRHRKPVSQLQQGQHPPSMGSVQQSPVSTPQQANISDLSSQNGINMLQPNINTHEANFNMLQLQDQYMKQQQEQHLLGLQQQSYPLQCNIPQRLHLSGQTPGSFFQTENVNDQQEQLYLSQKPLPETSSTYAYSTAQTGHASGDDWQEEVYQKIKAMKEIYLPELLEMYQKIAAKLQQLDSLPQQPKLEQLDKLKLFQSTLERAIQFLQVPKGNIGPMYKEKLAQYEKQIISFINTNRPRNPVS